MFDKHDIQVLNRAIAMIKDGSFNIECKINKTISNCEWEE